MKGVSNRHPQEKLLSKRPALLVLRSKYSLFDHAKQSSTDALETAPKKQLKKAEATANLIGNKTSDKITTASKTSPQNNSVANKEEVLKKRYASPE